MANAEQFDAWNGESGQRWVADPDRRDQVIEPVADALFAAAALRGGERVLDVGCGCGATTLAAAAAVAPNGSVVGIDLSEPMLSVARSRLERSDIGNVTLVRDDAQTHDFAGAGFDVAISRFGTMFFGDPEAAFGNIATALRPGGRLVVVTWQPLAANDWLTVPAEALLRYGSAPDLGGNGPGMFAQADPVDIRRVLEGAGLSAVEITPLTITLTVGANAREAAAHVADTGVGRALLATVPVEQQPVAVDAVVAALAPHADAAGVHLGAAVLMVRAERAA